MLLIPRTEERALKAVLNTCMQEYSSLVSGLACLKKHLELSISEVFGIGSGSCGMKTETVFTSLYKTFFYSQEYITLLSRRRGIKRGKCDGNKSDVIPALWELTNCRQRASCWRFVLEHICRLHHKESCPIKK